MGFFSVGLYYSVVIALGSFCYGQVMAWYSPNRTQLLAYFNITDSMGNILNLLAPLCAILGGYLGDVLVKFFGNRRSVFITGVVQSVTWIVIALLPASASWCIYFMRSIQGVCIGVVSGLCGMYIVEISPENLRGAYGVIHQLFVCIGCVYSFILGIFVNWRNFAWISIIPTGLNIILIWTVPNGKPQMPAIAEAQTTVPKESIFQKKFLVPCLHCLAFVCSQQFAGINAVFTNMTTIFEDAHVSIEPAIASLLTGIAQVIATAIASFLVEKMGRRPTWILSAGGQVLCLLLLWADELWNWHPIIPVIALFVYVFFFGLGFGPIPWLIIPELFPDSVRSVINSVSAAVDWAMCALVVFLWPYMLKGLGMGWGVFIFAMCCFLSFLYGIFLMPETKGKSMGRVENKACAAEANPVDEEQKPLSEEQKPLSEEFKEAKEV